MSIKHKALVTGSGGYIGSVLVKMLKEQGYYVIGVDLTQKHECRKYMDEIVVGDFADDDTLKKISEDTTVFHLAAHSLLGPSANEPIKYFFNNTVKTLKLIEFMLAHRAFKLIFASSAAVYSELQYATGVLSFSGLCQMRQPVKETGRVGPPNNYGMSKLHTEQMLNSICSVDNNITFPYSTLHAVSFRFFNVIGAYDDVGPSQKTPHILSSLVRAAKHTGKFVLNGDNYNTKDGTCIRDYVDVKDVCRAMIHADISLSVIQSKHDVYNLGTGKGYSNKEIIDVFNKVCSPWYDKSQFDLQVGPIRVGDPPYLVADPAKYIKETGFQYKYSDDLHTMISDVWRYFNGI